MAVSILVAAYEGLAERIILISSDTDLLPAIQKAQEKGKAVTYMGFSHKVSLAMVRSCRETETLTRDDLLPFVTDKTEKLKKAA